MISTNWRIYCNLFSSIFILALSILLKFLPLSEDCKIYVCIDILYGCFRTRKKHFFSIKLQLSKGHRNNSIKLSSISHIINSPVHGSAYFGWLLLLTFSSSSSLIFFSSCDHILALIVVDWL